MSLNDMKSLTEMQRRLLEDDDWTVEKLARAEVKELTKVKGIGTATAPKIISEALGIINISSLDSPKGSQYQNVPPRKVVLDWEEQGMNVLEIALASAGALVATKGVSQDLAIEVISAAQSIVNERNLYQGRQTAAIVMSSNPHAVSPAFPEEWLSGKVEPPQMSVRIKANFDQAKAAYVSRIS